MCWQVMSRGTPPIALHPSPAHLPHAGDSSFVTHALQTVRCGSALMGSCLMDHMHCSWHMARTSRVIVLTFFLARAMAGALAHGPRHRRVLRRLRLRLHGGAPAQRGRGGNERRPKHASGPQHSADMLTRTFGDCFSSAARLRRAGASGAGLLPIDRSDGSVITKGRARITRPVITTARDDSERPASQQTAR